jgi:hypothetical protein
VSGNTSTGINFGKYMDKRPKFEKEYGKKKEVIMQELSNYKPPQLGEDIEKLNYKV